MSVRCERRRHLHEDRSNNGQIYYSSDTKSLVNAIILHESRNFQHTNIIEVVLIHPDFPASPSLRFLAPAPQWLCRIPVQGNPSTQRVNLSHCAQLIKVAGISIGNMTTVPLNCYILLRRPCQLPRGFTYSQYIHTYIVSGEKQRSYVVSNSYWYNAQLGTKS